MYRVATSRACCATEGLALDRVGGGVVNGLDDPEVDPEDPFASGVSPLDPGEPALEA